MTGKVTPRLHFDGEPNRFAAMRQLFPQQSTLQVKYATADRTHPKLRLLLRSLDQWFGKYGRRVA